MPLFRYMITLGDETRVSELSKSNPQGWLADAVIAAFPKFGADRTAEIMRLRLERHDASKTTWYASFDQLHIEVRQVNRRTGS